MVGLGETFVVDAAVGVIAGGVARPSPELLPRVDVAYRPTRQISEQSGQGLLVELRGVPAIGRRPDIYNLFDSVP